MANPPSPVTYSQSPMLEPRSQPVRKPGTALPENSVPLGCVPSRELLEIVPVPDRTSRFEIEIRPERQSKMDKPSSDRGWQSRESPQGHARVLPADLTQWRDSVLPQGKDESSSSCHRAKRCVPNWYPRSSRPWNGPRRWPPRGGIR